MTIKRAGIAVTAVGVLTLAVASPVMATPAQARQIKALKLQLAKANRTIAARNKTIAADNATIKALRSVVFLPISGGAASLATITPAQAWPLVPVLYGIFSPLGFTINCGPNNWQATTRTDSTSNGDGSGFADVYYNFTQTTWRDPNHTGLCKS